ncbi:hypothetical protein G9P44_000224 [Scheffersomyces stipitis]|nr:hypothetical protein G9P44_000224 [Scheffersomyces stipitis]
MSDQGPRRRRKEVAETPGPEAETDGDGASDPTPQLSTLSLFIVLFIIRLVNALSIRTFFQADEYYQALEPAYNYVYGYGYITWEWREHLRSSIHPLLYSVGYQIAKCLNDSDFLVWAIPRIIGALIASIGEVNLYLFTREYTGQESLARITVLLSVGNPFNWYVSTRAFSNSFETALTTIALRYWPWNTTSDIQYDSFLTSIAFGAVSCIVRPTNAIIWMYLGIYYLWTIRASHVLDIVKLLFLALLELTTILAVNCVLDWAFYGELTFPLWNFLQFNLVKKLSIFYGVAPWHFYLFQAIPIFLMLYLPLFLHSLFVLQTYKLILTQVSVVVLVIFSLIEHKEFRFIYPLQPLFLVICSYSFKQVMKTFTAKQFAYTVNLMIIGNTAISYFFTRIHERGVIDVIDYIKNDSRASSVGFLTPCHSTPWQSQLHDPALESNTWFLTCEPPLHIASGDQKAILEYRDESDNYYDDRVKFLRETLPPLDTTSTTTTATKYQWPSHLVVFETEEKFITEFLQDSNYRQCQRFFNSYFHWDSRRSGDVIVFCNVDEETSS